MNKWRVILVLAIGLSLVAGCATENYNPYMLPGAGIGAAVGGAIGAGVNNRNPLKGAAIGALLGGATGAVAGEVYGRNKPYPYPPQQQGYYQSPPQQPQGYYQQAPPQPGYSYTPPASPNYN
jgi:hypothetical protein